MGVYQLSIAPSKHSQFFSGCGPGCGGGGCGEQKTWPISTKQSGGLSSIHVDHFVSMAVCDGGKGDDD